MSRRRYTADDYRREHQRFLEELGRTGSVPKAAKIMGWSRARGYQVAERMGIRSERRLVMVEAEEK